MADFHPKTEAWTRYSQAALTAIIAASPQIGPNTAAKKAGEYADAMLAQWLEKVATLKAERVGGGRSGSDRSE